MSDDPPIDIDVDPAATVVPPIQQFRAALPDHIGSRIHTGASTITALREAIDRGWTIPVLAAHCMSFVGARAERPAGVVHYRLMQAAKTDPPARTATGATRPGPGSCSRCGKATTARTLRGRVLCPGCMTTTTDTGTVSTRPPAEARALIDQLRRSQLRTKGEAE